MRKLTTYIKGLITPKQINPLLNYQPVNTIPEAEVVTNIEEWGSSQAQMHNGSDAGLINSLTRLERGYIVESGNEKNKQDEAKKLYIDQINLNDKNIVNKNAEIDDIEKTKIPFQNKKIEENKKEITDLEMDKSKSIIASDYSPVKNYFSLTLVIVIGIYLLMFYASAINAALFTNMGNKLAGITTDNIDALFVSIFDADVYTVWTSNSIFIYFAAFLFIGIGFIPHTTTNKIKKIFFYLFPLLVDAMLAYKIESNIHDSKVLTGLAEPYANWWNHMESVNFWLVLAFGYVAYIIWGQLWESWISENRKKDAGKMAHIQIINFKKQIKQYEDQIQKYKSEINRLNSDITELNKDIELLNNRMNYVVYSRHDLSRKLSTFFDGWLKYISLNSRLEQHIESNKETYNNFYNTLNLN